MVSAGCENVLFVTPGRSINMLTSVKKCTGVDSS